MATGFIEDVHKQEREAATKEAQAKEPQGPTLDTILADHDESGLLGMYLDEQGDHALAEKVITGNLSEQDFFILSEKRKEFLAVKQEAGEVRKMVEDNFDAMVATSPEFKKILEVAGKGGIDKALIKRIDKLSISDPKWLNNMKEKLQGIKDAEAQITVQNNYIALICKEQGFTPAEYKKALQDSEGDELALGKLMKSKLGFFKRMVTSVESLEEKADKIDKRDDIKERIRLLEKSQREVAESLQATLFGDEATKKILIGHLRGAEPVPRHTSFMEADKLVEPASDFKKVIPATQAEWDAYKATHQGDADFNIDSAYDDFIGRTVEDQIAQKGVPKHKGFWAEIMKKIFGGAIKQKIIK